MSEASQEQQATPSLSRLLTYEEAAEILRVCVRTLASIVKRGELLAVKIGSRVLFDPHDLQQFIEGKKGKVLA